MTTIPTINALTPDNRPWRIDWFGEIAYPGSVRQYRQPCIKVAISPLLDPPESLSFANNFRTGIQSQRNVWMSIGSLPMLRIGDIWQDGRRVDAPMYSQNIFDLKIGPSATEWMKAGSAVGGNHFLPFEKHPWHRQHTQTYCLAVDAGDNVTLIIPGAELVRFYFGSSSNLLKRLVTAPLSEELLWHRKHYDSETRHLHLKLANGMSTASATDIGRIAGDPHAWKAAASIYAYCMQATAQKEPAYLRTDFPFQGETSVVAAGIWLPFGDNPRSNYLVFNLRSCDYPFPFGSLTIDRGDDHLDNRNGDANASKDAQARKRYGVKKDGATLSTGDPGTGKSHRRFSFDHSVRFPDLRRKPVWWEKVVAGKSTGIVIRRADGSLDVVAFGEPKGSRRARAVDGCQGEPHAEAVEMAPEKLPYFVRAGIKLAISQQPGGGNGVTARLLQRFGTAEPVFLLPRFVDEDGVIDPRFMYCEPDGSHRELRACFVELFRDGEALKKCAVVEGESIGKPPQVIDVPGATLETLITALTGLAEEIER